MTRKEQIDEFANSQVDCEFFNEDLHKGIIIGANWADEHPNTEEEGSIRLTAVPLSFIEPIPLTPEILEKNGFVDYEVGKGWYVLNVADDLRVWLHRNSHDWTFQFMKWSPLYTHEIGKVFINHTHQLQHALRLAGVEKEIEL